MHLTKTLAWTAAGALGLALTAVAAPANAAPGIPPGLTVCYPDQATTTSYEAVFDYDESRTGGSYEATADGLRIATSGTTSVDKVALYQFADLALADAGDFDLDYTSDAGSLPGGQLLVDLDGDGTLTGYLVYEPGAYGEGNWWLSANWGDDIDPAASPVTAVGGGGLDWAQFSEWTAAFPDARILAVGFSLGSGAYGVGTVHGITVAGASYAFAEEIETTVLGDPAVCNRDGVVVPGIKVPTED